MVTSRIINNRVIAVSIPYRCLRGNVRTMVSSTDANARGASVCSMAMGNDYCMVLIVTSIYDKLMTLFIRICYYRYDVT